MPDHGAAVRLAARATELSALIPPSPEWPDDGVCSDAMVAEMQAHWDWEDAASDTVFDESDGDTELLEAALREYGPPDDEGLYPPGGQILHAAALRAKRLREPPGDVAALLVRSACLCAHVALTTEDRRRWIETGLARRLRDQPDPGSIVDRARLAAREELHAYIGRMEAIGEPTRPDVGLWLVDLLGILDDVEAYATDKR